jgi:hypothetical protein
MEIKFTKPEEKSIAKISFNTSFETKMKLERISKIEQISISNVITQIVDQVYQQLYDQETIGG